MLFHFLDFFIALFRRRLFHEPPAFRTIIKKSPGFVKYLNFGITCASSLLLLTGSIGAFGSGTPMAAAKSPAISQGKPLIIEYSQLLEHAALQNDVTFGRYRKPDQRYPGTSTMAVFPGVRRTRA